MARPQDDRNALRRALDLARQGSPWVTPNPMVGCVIVKDGRVIAEAYHKRFGGPHAEVLALKAAGSRARGATLFVNLEPCAHEGKTPPCTDAIIRAGVEAVVACTRDPNPLVAGKGFRTLGRAGIDVRTGTLRREALALNERFVWAHTHGRPFIAVKVAQTLDARIADVRGRSKWITSLESRRRAHELRSEYEAVLVGAGTVVADDPALNVRLVNGRQPIRIILDGQFRVSERAKVFRNRGGRLMLLTSIPALHRNARRALALERRGIEVVGIGRREVIPTAHVVGYLADRRISSVLVEGGARTASAFVRDGFAERFHAFVAPGILGSGRTALSFGGILDVKHMARLEDVTIEPIGNDVLISGRFPGR